MDLRFLGGVEEIGRSSVEVDDILIDYGVKTGTPTEFPVDSSVDPSAVLVSHGHLDHVGAVPTLMNRKPPVHETAPSRDLARLLAEDTLKIARRNRFNMPFSGEDVHRLSETAHVHPENTVFEIDGYTIEFHRAGHIPGSVMIEVEKNGTSLLYTGDYNTGDTRLLKSAVEPPKVDAVVTESTYFTRKHPDREKLEREFVQSIRETLYEGGDVVIPVFGIGRTQEILMVLAAHDVPCYVDGMGCDVTRIFRQYPEYLRDADALKDAWNHTEEVKTGERNRVLDRGKAVVTTSGMLSGGPAMKYIKDIYQDPTNKICLTGYQVEGTPGRSLLDSGAAEIDDRYLRFSCQVELHDFSAHADALGLRGYIRRAVDNGAEKVFCVHGDPEDCGKFSEWIERELGITAHVPCIGEKFEI
ncbi:MAG: MBL fold metallo-hydrolase [Halobacteria archaeon]